MLREQPVRTAAPGRAAQLRDGAGFALRAIMNPLFFLFIFAFVFPRTGQGFSGAGGASFATILVPGLVAVAIFFQESRPSPCPWPWSWAAPARSRTG